MAIISKDAFFINGVSSDTVGIYADTPLVPPMAHQRYTVTRNGQDEDLTMPDDTFEDIVYNIPFYTFFRDDFDDTEIHTFLLGAETLQLSRLPGRYFKIKEIDLTNVTTEYDANKISYNLQLMLSPFRYNTNNPEITLQSGDIITNSGNRYCKPLIKITGRSPSLIPREDIKVIVNGQSITVSVANNQVVYIDSAREIVYSDNILLRDCVIGKYPLLSPGYNTISWEGIISTMTIQKNERWY